MATVIKRDRWSVVYVRGKPAGFVLKPDDEHPARFIPKGEGYMRESDLWDIIAAVSQAKGAK